MDYTGTQIDQVSGGLSMNQQDVHSLPDVHSLTLLEGHSVNFSNKFSAGVLHDEICSSVTP